MVLQKPQISQSLQQLQKRNLLVVLRLQLECVAALHSPSTGIVDSHAFMLALQGDLENAGGLVALNSPLASALMRVGIAPTLIGTRGAHPALRISGRRRLSRLVENVGEPPDGPEALVSWPRV